MTIKIEAKQRLTASMTAPEAAQAALVKALDGSPIRFRPVAYIKGGEKHPSLGTVTFPGNATLYCTFESTDKKSFAYTFYVGSGREDALKQTPSLAPAHNKNMETYAQLAKKIKGAKVVLPADLGIAITSFYLTLKA